MITWSSKDFFNEFNKVKTNYLEMKKLRASVFYNTMDIAEQGYYMIGDKRIEITIPTDAVVYKKTQPIKAETLEQPTEIAIENEDCMVVGINLLNKGYKPLILNMANAFNAGGGVTRGSMAQEEEIFRCTNIHETLFPLHEKLAKEHGFDIKDKNGYPITKYGAIYSPSVVIFRKGKKYGYELMEEPIKMAFISAAAFKNPTLVDEDTLASYLVPQMMEKIRAILRVALENGHDAFVLGAWGCGAFKNPPKHIAKLFHEVLEEEEFKNKFKNITFAIIEDYNSLKDRRKGNLRPFKEEFEGE